MTYADVDVTNTAAERGAFDLVKVSYAALPWLLDHYQLLPCGGALGRGCGPLVLVTAGDRRDLAGATVAVPGDRTTAYLLFRLWSAGQPPARIEVVPFHKIMPGVRRRPIRRRTGDPRSAIHLPRHGLTALVDLGEWWEARNRVADPARRDLGETGHGGSRRRGRDGFAPRSSRAWANPDASREYVLAHAQEMEPEVVDRAHRAVRQRVHRPTWARRAGQRSTTLLTGRAG